MGLWGEDLGFQLPERLPDLPKSAREGADLEAQAIAQRLDVQGARSDADSLAKSLGLTKVTRFINLLEVGCSATARPACRAQTRIRDRDRRCRSSISAAQGSRARSGCICRR